MTGTIDVATLEALSAFERADQIDLDCGQFDIIVKPAAMHNDRFKAAAGRRALEAKKKTLVVSSTSITGTFEQDVELFLDEIIVGWGTRPLADNDGSPIPYSKDLMRQIFTKTKNGKVMFGKIQTAAVDDELFVLREEDLGNS